MRTQDLIADALLTTKTLTGRYLGGFDDASALQQPTGLPNHVIWNLGHVAITMHRVAERIDGKPLPESDFVLGPRGDARRFGTESVAFGSTPRPTAEEYPSLRRAQEIHDAAVDRLSMAARGASDATLQQMTPWGGPGQEMPIAILALRMMYHNGMHTGQIADTRRALGMKSIFG
jgi:hypothetical protein